MDMSTHKTDNTVDHVLVSQGTRNDAKPAEYLRFESYREEYDYWVAQKRKVEADLARYSKAGFAATQARIRREHKNRNTKDSFDAWISEKARMEDARLKLLSRKNEVEDEILRLRPLLKAENLRKAAPVTTDKSGRPQGVRLEDFKLFREDGTLSWDGVASQLLLELRAIRELLESRQ